MRRSLQENPPRKPSSGARHRSPFFSLKKFADGCDVFADSCVIIDVCGGKHRLRAAPRDSGPKPGIFTIV